jgi:ketosteroid isomerase-like protein
VSAEENIATVRRYFDEVLSKGNRPVIDEIIAPDFRVPLHPGFELPPGPEGAWISSSGVRRGFPDVQFTIDDIFADGDSVAVRASWTGTHQGGFQGVSATGKPASATILSIFRFKNGKITERWTVQDRLAVIQQLVPVSIPG